MKLFALIIILLGGIFIYYLYANKKISWFKGSTVSAGTTSNRDSKTGSSNISIEKTWELPAELKEISGLAYIGDNTFACVQDEEGKIFIYDAGSEEVEEIIPFGEADDYEGIAIVGNNAYVVNSSGKITEIVNYRSDKPATRSIITKLTARENIEGLCFDQKNNRLLLAVKDRDANSSDYKGIYAYDLSQKIFIDEPVYIIELNNSLFDENSKKRAQTAISPSGISIHPVTGDLYIVDGRKPQVLIMNNKGEISSLTRLTAAAFSQPEGITFDEKGNLFISNEGLKNPGNIVQVSMN